MGEGCNEPRQEGIGQEQLDYPAALAPQHSPMGDN
jgi:hypothetical protein